MGISLVNKLSDSDLKKIESHIFAHQGVPGALMPLLHAVQDDIGYVPEEIYPVGKHVLQVCRAESCQAMGSEKLESEIKAKLGIDYHQTTMDGEVTLLPVYCLGNCACSPAVMMDDEVYGRVDAQAIAELVSEVSNG